ncbi:hypothetical protein BDK51DRAFT_49288 [Blyttiomyces helicus]|uniref:Reverse transcriptase domain-containing protein n=1 Tax=Blyttiomyces helicus TaxID=388810 RepID=A0A4P9WFD9_9FUNG|nr:hypothetical protein BDK51DRAFT_49288 [Blyttiomyces helicus]|eukprot:RKO90463.1 hypothetical protein BDK51DRAFT_49288 [Blyttiomyces helicus]
MLDQGIIYPNCSPWSFPVVIVPKQKTNKKRFWVDFRELNAVTIRDPFLVPDMFDLIERIAPFRWKSALDVLNPPTCHPPWTVFFTPPPTRKLPLPQLKLSIRTALDLTPWANILEQSL